MPNKTDRNDARGLAQIIRTGWYRTVHVKDASCRALLTARRMALNKWHDVENGIQALLREVGLKVGTPSRKDFPARVSELAADDPVLGVGPLTALALRVTIDQPDCFRKSRDVGAHFDLTPRRYSTIHSHSISVIGFRTVGSMVSRARDRSKGIDRVLTVRRDRRARPHQPLRR